MKIKILSTSSFTVSYLPLSLSSDPFLPLRPPWLRRCPHPLLTNFDRHSAAISSCPTASMSVNPIILTALPSFLSPKSTFPEAHSSTVDIQGKASKLDRSNKGWSMTMFKNASSLLFSTRIFSQNPTFYNVLSLFSFTTRISPSSKPVGGSIRVRGGGVFWIKKRIKMEAVGAGGDDGGVAVDVGEGGDKGGIEATAGEGKKLVAPKSKREIGRG